MQEPQNLYVIICQYRKEFDDDELRLSTWLAILFISNEVQGMVLSFTHQFPFLEAVHCAKHPEYISWTLS